MANIDQVISSLIADLEGEENTKLVKLGDEYTVFGISSKFRPQFTSKYSAAKARGDATLMVALKAEAAEIYRRDYVQQIRGHAELDREFPALLALLFLGKVHGLGFQHYVREVQAWILVNARVDLDVDGKWGPASLSATRLLSMAQKDALIAFLARPATTGKLVALRQRAVRTGGTRGVERGIKARVGKELAIAREIQKGTSAEVALAGVSPLEVNYGNRPDRASTPAAEGTRRTTIYLA